MAVAVSKPSNFAGRSDDVRSLRFRVRNLTFTGNYATGGETVTAASLGLKYILIALPMNAVTAASAGVTGSLVKLDIASDNKSVVIRQLEDAAGAAGTAIGQEKTNAEAYTGTTAVHRVLFVGV